MGKTQIQNNTTNQQNQQSSGLPQVTHNNYVQQNTNMNGNMQGNPTQNATNQSSNPQFVQPQQAPSNQQNNNISRSRTGSDRAQVLRHQQQRLLLLRHAAKCPHEDGRCPVTPHCSGMKRLWKHIAECKNQKCQVPHCVSSRYVLSHYHRCKDVRCPVCGPVREAIHRSHEKQKELKRKHEQAMEQKQNAMNGATVPPVKKQKVEQNPTVPTTMCLPIAPSVTPNQATNQIPSQPQNLVQKRPPPQPISSTQPLPQ